MESIRESLASTLTVTKSGGWSNPPRAEFFGLRAKESGQMDRQPTQSQITPIGELSAAYPSQAKVSAQLHDLTVPMTVTVGAYDNERYHHSRLHRPWRDQHAPHFALDFLPPYSPELNPIERVWKLTRRRCLHNRYFDHLQDVIAAVKSEFTTWTTRNDVLRRLCAST